MPFLESLIHIKSKAHKFKLTSQLDFQMVGASLFALTIWMASEPNFGEWISLLDAQVYFIGIYVLIIASIIVMIVSFLGCCSALMEHTLGLAVVSQHIASSQIPQILIFQMYTYLYLCILEWMLVMWRVGWLTFILHLQCVEIENWIWSVGCCLMQPQGVCMWYCTARKWWRLHNEFWLQYIGTQVLGFLINTAGAAILLDFSTVNSSIQPILRRQLTWLIMRSESPPQETVLRLVQESVRCFVAVLLII